MSNAARDHSIDWSWTPAQGYPDQFRRDRIVVLDPVGDCGYSSWTQLPDGRIVIVDYTQAKPLGGPVAGDLAKHRIRAYLVTEQDLVRGEEAETPPQ